MLVHIEFGHMHNRYHRYHWSDNCNWWFDVSVFGWTYFTDPKVLRLRLLPAEPKWNSSLVHETVTADIYYNNVTSLHINDTWLFLPKENIKDHNHSLS